MHYLGIQYCNDDQTKASNQTSALLSAHPNLKGIFAMNVVSGNGVTAAVKSAGKAGVVKLVEFDAGPPQVQALKEGTINALVAQYPYGIGYQAVQLAYKYVTGQKAGIAKHYGTGSAVVTKAERQLAVDQEVPLHAVTARVGGGRRARPRRPVES